MADASALDEKRAPALGCSCHRLRKLTRLMSQRYDQALAPAGLNVNQYAILRRASGTARSISALAVELGMDRTTLSRDLRPLEAEGWVHLRADRADARQRLVDVTASGRRTVERARPLWASVQAEVEALVGRDDVERLHQALDLATARLAS